MIAFIGVSAAKATALTTAKQPVPNRVQISAMIDTGASGTCIDPSILKALGLTPTGKATVNTPTTGATPEIKDQYDVSLTVPGAVATHAPLFVPTLAVIEAELLFQGFHALIGRDVLATCVLVYN
ncbi:MAG: aspartyl protease family protein, partial [Candidatus Acidiferrales bacterium]